MYDRVLITPLKLLKTLIEFDQYAKKGKKQEKKDHLFQINTVT